MFCAQCGAQTDESDKFCSQCGTARPLHHKGHNRLLWIAGGSIGLLCLLLVIGSVRSAQHLDEVVGDTATKQGATEEGEATSATLQESEPPSADVVLHAYDVLKNPYGYKNRLVVLDVMERPVLFNGSLFQYAGGVDPRVATSLGMAGVRFDRMLTEDTAVYDVMALDANNNSDPELIGQLAVLLPSGRGQLELGPDWEVEPLGTVEGTNGFGARMQVPEVRFWRYHGEQQRTPPTTPTSVLSGDGRTAVELVKAKIRPSSYLLSLKADDATAEWSAVDNHWDCAACW
jgi:hypothetical protein